MNKEDRVLKKIKHVEMKTKKLVNALVLGNYRAVMKGQGMTFSDFREYVPGDDVRNISWSLIAKTNKPYVKQYEEERELNTYFLVDTDYSLYNGADKFLKIELALYGVAALALAAQKNNDLTSLILYSKYLRSFTPPKKGKVHIRRIISELINVEPELGNGNGLVDACEMVLKHQKKKSVVFIFSDFLRIENAKVSLQALAKKHQVVACVLSHPQEGSLSSFGAVKVANSLSKDEQIVNSSSLSMKRLYAEFFNSKVIRRQKVLKSCGVDMINLNTQEDIYKPMLKYFKSRAKKA